MSIFRRIALLFGGTEPFRVLSERDLAILGALHVAEGEWMSGPDFSNAYGFLMVYPSLVKLERLGLITSRWEDEPWPRRRVYTLSTERGR